jgi:thiol-disulfide isomerase/thioredoxin
MDDPEQLLDRLVEAGVLVETDGGRLKPSSAFERQRRASRDDLESADTAARRERFAEHADLDPGALTDDLLADARAIRRLDDGLGRRAAAVAADALERFVDDGIADGVPEGFVPVRPGEVDQFLDRHEASVLYFWGDDCDPCEAVRLEFEGLVQEGRIPDEVALGAVYLGAEAQVSAADVERIAGEWQVATVPTTLFFDGRSVDTRLIGTKRAGHFEREMEILVEEYVKGGDRTDGRNEVDELLEARARGELDGNVIDVLEERDRKAAERLETAPESDPEAVTESGPEASLTSDIDDLLDTNSDLEVEVDPADFAADDVDVDADVDFGAEDKKDGEGDA